MPLGMKFDVAVLLLLLLRLLRLLLKVVNCLTTRLALFSRVTFLFLSMLPDSVVVVLDVMLESASEDESDSDILKPSGGAW